MVKDKTIDEGKRIQYLYQSILMVKPNGKIYGRISKVPTIVIIKSIESLILKY